MIENILNAQNKIMKILERELLDLDMPVKGLAMLKDYYITKYTDSVEYKLDSFRGMVLFFTEYVNKLMQLVDSYK